MSTKLVDTGTLVSRMMFVTATTFQNRYSALPCVPAVRQANCKAEPEKPTLFLTQPHILSKEAAKKQTQIIKMQKNTANLKINTYLCK